MALPPKRTLIELRDELRARLGFSAAGTVSDRQAAILDSMLRSAQEQMYWQYDFPEMRRIHQLQLFSREGTDITFTAPSTIASVTTDLSIFGSSGEVMVQSGSGVNDDTYTVTASDATSITIAETLSNDASPGTVKLWRRHYEWPDDIEPRRIIGIYVEYSDVWFNLEPGIEFYHDTLADEPSDFPRRYDVADTLEIWPDPNDTYPARIEYYRRLDPFREPEHRTTLDSELVFLHALAAAKLHYKQGDAEVVAAQAQAFIERVREGAHYGRTYVRGRHAPRRREALELPEPKRVP